MNKLLIVVDMQNDFITGSLGTAEAEQILPDVREKIKEYRENGGTILFTRDTHYENYLTTQEGRNLPVEHCIEGTAGHQIEESLLTEGCEIFDKPSFGSLELAEKAAVGRYDEIELCGLCTDICVVSNALILKARLPETKVSVDAACCAGVSVESHKTALATMKMCQVNVTNMTNEGETDV